MKLNSHKSVIFALFCSSIALSSSIKNNSLTYKELIIALGFVYIYFSYCYNNFVFEKSKVIIYNYFRVFRKRKIVIEYIDVSSISFSFKGLAPTIIIYFKNDKIKEYVIQNWNNEKRKNIIEMLGEKNVDAKIENRCP